MPSLIDRTGLKLHDWTFLKYAGAQRWRVKCVCGSIVVRKTNTILEGRSRSCGCRAGARISDAKRKYGPVSSRRIPEYGVWQKMISRCHNRRDRGFSAWGGRGIRVHESWRKDFTQFFAYVGARPSPAHSIDRIDNDGDYEPGNVRWATRRQQARNRRSTLMVTVRGRTLPFHKWSEKFAYLSYDLFLARRKRGWSEEDAVLTPLIEPQEAGRRSGAARRQKRAPRR